MKEDDEPVELLSVGIGKLNQADGLGALHYLRLALAHARSKNDSEQIRAIKKLMVSAGEVTLTQMHELSFEQNITDEQLRASIGDVLDDQNIFRVLVKVALFKKFLPNVAKVRKMSEKMPLAMILGSLVTVSRDGHVVSGGSDPHKSNYFRNYQLTQDLIVHLYLKTIFNHFMRSPDDVSKMNEGVVMRFFDESNALTQDDREFLSVAVTAFFAKNYPVFLHIAVPRFEGVLMRILAGNNVDVIALERGEDATRTRVLSDSFLRQDAVEKFLGEDFCEQIIVNLLDPLGQKIRHKIAHGEIAADECNEENAILILQMFMRLCGIFAQKQSESN